MHHLKRNSQTNICWLCDAATKDQVSSWNLLQKMQLDVLALVDTDGMAMKKDLGTQLQSRSGPWLSCPKKTWSDVIRVHYLVPGLSKTNPFGWDLGVTHTEVTSACIHDTQRTIQIPYKLNLDDDDVDYDDDDNHVNDWYWRGFDNSYVQMFCIMYDAIGYVLDWYCSQSYN